MSTRERDQQAEQERLRLEQELAQQQQQQQRSPRSPREQQSIGDTELSNNPVIINK